MAAAPDTAPPHGTTSEHHHGLHSVLVEARERAGKRRELKKNRTIAMAAAEASQSADGELSSPWASELFSRMDQLETCVHESEARLLKELGSIRQLLLGSAQALSDDGGKTVDVGTVRVVPGSPRVQQAAWLADEEARANTPDSTLMTLQG